MPVQLVIFDCGGVLVDSEAISTVVLAAMLTEQGLRLTDNEVRRLFSARRAADIAQSVEHRLKAKLPEGWAKDLERRRGEAFLDASLQPEPGAAEVITALKTAGIDVCVASHASHARMRLSLATTSLLSLFDEDALFTADTVRMGKPNPELFLRAAAARSADPNATVVVEDNATGIAAARAAEMCPIGYRPAGNRKALRKVGAWEVISTLHELPELVGI